ncbi:hypothetical protein ACETAC_10335 [Aceticella autotrophica]|uniref:Uncharacterized protein n=1 Tax=Aceticella autotrophica TaxID=2755338 RepID=A0A975AVI3_9THEO|nr:hypothetical protein [Aceticella autotrophica]QSZ27217.1 hypothetical protein ACETAC_10335 [Aceticella autotrophica]
MKDLTNITEGYDEELIAVISAAVAATIGDDIGKFKVKSIVRIPQTSPVWRRIGVQEQMNSRL